MYLVTIAHVLKCSNTCTMDDFTVLSYLFMSDPWSINTIHCQTQGVMEPLNESDADCHSKFKYDYLLKRPLNNSEKSAESRNTPHGKQKHTSSQRTLCSCVFVFWLLFYALSTTFSVNKSDPSSPAECPRPQPGSQPAGGPGSVRRVSLVSLTFRGVPSPPRPAPAAAVSGSSSPCHPRPSIMSEEKPAPRLCHLVKWTTFDGYGFSLHTEKTKPGQHIGKVDPDSPAEACGLRDRDRIIEVNGSAIAGWGHSAVVAAIKKEPERVSLLVVDEAGWEHFSSRGVTVTATMEGVQERSAEGREPAKLQVRGRGSREGLSLRVETVSE